MWWLKVLFFLAMVVLVYWFYDQKDQETDTRKFKSVGEELCAKILEEVYNRKALINTRPDFLKNPLTNRNMELDVYDPISKNAIEYNGIQHYVYPNTFHKTKEDFDKQQERDKLKKKICKKQKINLIVVPYTVDDGMKDHKVRRAALKAYIIPRLK